MDVLVTAAFRFSLFLLNPVGLDRILVGNGPVDVVVKHQQCSEVVSSVYYLTPVHSLKTI